MEKKSGRDGKKTIPPKPGTPASPNWTRLWWYLPLALLLLWMWQDILFQAAVETIPYSQFKQHIAAREVKQCEIHDIEIVGEIVPKKSVAVTDAPQPAPQAAPQPAISTPEAASPQPSADPKTPETPANGVESAAAQGAQQTAPFRFRTVRVEDPELIKQLDDHEIDYVAVRPGLLSNFIFAWLLPMGMIVGLWLLLSRRLGAPGQAVMSIGKSRATLVGDKDTGVAFDDVAGCDEAKAELQEVVDFLKNPDRYAALGAKIPKGVLLVGPPGTGKTLLARAVAGEAKVPFFSLSGSDFVEMFVGVGASRVRDLFNQAVGQAPCIVFIDELDAIGRERGVHVGAVNDEREQTLDQLLVEMDGFEPNSGVILLAATNRPEVLDRALLRPGRFDRQVVVDAPDLEGRVAILHVHCRQKPLAEDVDLQKIARGTPGFSGADLANIANEAALLAARRSSSVIKQADFEEAIEKVVAGPERKSRRLEEDEKRRVAYHEVGHALVGAFSEHADPVHKISIVPRGRAALGYTLQLPTGQTFLQTRSELVDKIKVLLGGRAAEEIVFGEVSTGAENDLERATDIARQMVCMFGMSSSVGLIHCARRQSLFLSPDGSGRLDCSDATAEKADREVQELLHEAYGDARKILEQRRELLDAVSTQLFDQETIDGPAFYRLIQPSPDPSREKSQQDAT